MIRTQIQLTEEQARALKALAARRGVPMAELIREAAEHIIAENEEAEKWRRASSIIGRYRSGRSDISVEHDKYLAGDYLKPSRAIEYAKNAVPTTNTATKLA